MMLELSESSHKLTGLVILVVLSLLTILYGLIYILAHRPEPHTESDGYYLTSDIRNFPSRRTEKGTSRIRYKLPSINDPPEVHLSVIVPAYNERKRIEIMLNEALNVLRDEFPEKKGLEAMNRNANSNRGRINGDNTTSSDSKTSGWEILVVDDGSRDDTLDIVLNWADRNELSPGQVRAVRLAKNRGKGGAVRFGMNHSRGEYVIFADADGASKFDDVTKLYEGALRLQETVMNKDKAAVAIGSRAHMVKSDAVVKRSFIRNLLMYGLHTLVFIFGIRSINDTQCGFKLFTRSAAREIFKRTHNEGWIFDVEILLLAERLKIPVEEIPISWHEVEGSKMELARDSIKMAIDLVVIRMAYILGIYTI